MDNVITAQIMNNLQYDIGEPPQMLGPNYLKRIKGMQKLKVVTDKVSLVEVRKKIQENIDILARYEAEDNCIPYEGAKKRITEAIQFMNLSDIQISPEVLLGDTEGYTYISRILWYQSISKIFHSIFFTLSGGFEELSITYDAPRKRLIEFLFLELLAYRKKVHEDIPVKTISFEPLLYSAMFVFQSSDLDAAVFYINKSFEDPTNELNVKTVYVQESCFDRFCKKLQRQLHLYPTELLRDEVFVERYNLTQEVLNKLNASTIKPFDENVKIVPTLCHEFDLKYFPDFAPIIIVKVFRTLKEAINMAKVDKFRAATIWTQNFSIAYEVINTLNYEYFYINCFGLESKMWKTVNLLTNIVGFKKAFTKITCSGVSIENNYHFEYFVSEEICKKIAFPFGNIFAN